MTKKKQNAIYWILGILAVGLFVFFARQGFSIANPDYTDNFGAVVQSRLQMFSVFDSSQKTGECGVDGQKVAFCAISPSSTASMLELNKGWSGYKSCAGFMSHYGCNPNNCELRNGGVCSGSVSDNPQCNRDAECNIGQYCDYGTCKDNKASECTQGQYKCIGDGQVLQCFGQIWKSTSSHCEYVYGSRSCAKEIGYSPYDVCKTSCNTDSECISGQICRSGSCIKTTTPDNYDQVINNQKQLACEKSGMKWNGFSCVQPQNDNTESGETEQNQIECTENLLATCNDGSTIVAQVCNNGMWVLDSGEKCSDNSEPIIKKKIDIMQFLSSNLIYVGLGGVILLIAIYYVKSKR